MLALAQSELVAQRLRAVGHDVELVRIVTEGDVRPVDTSPGEGMFVTALASAVKRREIDIAVHSAKDVPLEEDPELLTAAYPERADARDALVTRSGHRSIASLRPDASVGTDSPRRAGFLRAARRDLRIVPLHGNVDTRLRRLDAGEVDALVIAAAGLDRLVAESGSISESMCTSSRPRRRRERSRSRLCVPTPHSWPLWRCSTPPKSGSLSRPSGRCWPRPAARAGHRWGLSRFSEKTTSRWLSAASTVTAPT